MGYSHFCSNKITHWHSLMHQWPSHFHYGDVIMDAIASQITSLTIVYSIVYSDGDQRKHQSSASLAFVRGIHRGPVNSPHKWPVTRKMSPFDDVIMCYQLLVISTKPLHCEYGHDIGPNEWIILSQNTTIFKIMRFEKFICWKRPFGFCPLVSLQQSAFLH